MAWSPARLTSAQLLHWRSPHKRSSGRATGPSYTADTHAINTTLFYRERPARLARAGRATAACAPGAQPAPLRAPSAHPRASCCRLSPGCPSAGCPESEAKQVKRAAAARPCASASSAAERCAAMRVSAPRAARGFHRRPRSAPAPAAKRCTPGCLRPGGLAPGSSSCAREWALGARGGAG